MKKDCKIFLNQFLIMSIYVWGIDIYGAIVKGFNPAGGEIAILFLVLIQTVITFLICLFFVFKTKGDITAFKTLGINILSIAISIIIYLGVDHYWLSIYNFISKKN